MGSAAGNGIDSVIAGVYGLARDRRPAYHYADETPLLYPITAFGGARDRRISEREIVEWRQQTDEDFRYEMFDADHFFQQDKREQLIDSIMRDPRALSPAVLDA
jgi:surfactin synthase thioesterase subunit